MSYVDAPAALHGAGQKLTFTSLITEDTVSFNAFITQLNDSFKSEWTRESAYGRMDDIQAFKATKRQISFAWTIVAADDTEAKKNLDNIGKLTRMLYPRYSAIESSAASAISAAPLIKIKFGNLISDAASGKGLVGTLDGVEYDFDIEKGATFYDGSNFFPQIIKASCVMHPLHTHDLGFYHKSDDKGSFAGTKLGFPYSGSPTSKPTNTPTNTDKGAKDQKMDGETEAKKKEVLT